MLKRIKAKIEGEAPLLMHSALLNDPLSEVSLAMREISRRRSKSEDDIMELARLEFLGGLYVNEKQRPVVPGPNIESCIVDGAKAQKLGKRFKAGVFVNHDPELEYDGPRTPERLFKDARFRDTRRVKVGQSGVMRTRPIFQQWALEFSIDYNVEAADFRTIECALVQAGRMVGLCDYRPRFGRFRVVSMDEEQ